MLTAAHPDRVTALVAIAAVSRSYTFSGGIEDALLGGRFGRWLMRGTARHSPKSLITSTVREEGDLTSEQVKDLTEQNWQDETARDFVMTLAGTVAGRKVGLHNDHRQFPQLGDLPLGSIRTPTMLVHGTADSDVAPAYSDVALAQIPNSEILRIDNGTHIAVWTDPASEEVQRRIVDFLHAGSHRDPSDRLP